MIAVLGSFVFSNKDSDNQLDESHKLIETANYVLDQTAAIQTLLPLLLTQDLKSVAWEVDLGGVHGDGSRWLPEASGGALHDVDAPAEVMIAGAVVRTRLLAVTSIKITAMTEREAVGSVGAEEVSALGLKHCQNYLSSFFKLF